MSHWTLEAYVAHNEAMRAAEKELQEERDRRYTEINLEREKALRIKEEADKVALLLAREIQNYKDMKANELREQIASERGNYATKADLIGMGEKFEAMNKPMMEFVAVQQGRGVGISASWSAIFSGVALLVGLLIIGAFVFQGRSSSPQPQVIVMPAPVNAPPTTTTTTTVPAPR